MIPRKVFDLGLGDLAAGIRASLGPGDPHALRQRVEDLWEPERTFAALSVRSAWDLLLEALDLPPGSEVIYSAATIVQMVELIEAHGLVPVPVDVDPVTLQPPPGAVEEALTARTRVLLLAHLFGSRIDLAPFAALARHRGLLLVEDCAHAFVGRDWTGHEEADVSLFSFGSIKTATALGGALATVRRPDLLSTLRILDRTRVIQSRLAFVAKVFKYAGLSALLHPTAYGLLFRLLERAGRDPDRTVNESVRGFVGPRWIQAIRRRPSAPLLALLQRRLLTYGPERIEERRARGARLARRLEGLVGLPGSGARDLTYWVFPVLVDDPAALLRRLRRGGFDAATGTASFAVALPRDGGQERVPRISAAFRHLVYLPVHRGLPRARENALCAAVRRAVRAVEAPR